MITYILACALTLQELRLLFKDQAIDVFLISETWLNDNVSDDEL